MSCSLSKATVQIPDYLIVANGKSIIGTKNLNAFLFENNVKGVQFEEYLSVIYNSPSIQEREYWIKIDGKRYKMLIYENAEFEKYFGSANYSPIVLEPKNDRYSQVNFLAVSVIDENNEDCLSDKSLYQNLVVKYLTNLKDEYRKNGNK